VPFLLGLAGVLTPSTPGLLPFLIAWTFFTHAPISVLTISVMSILGDVADENALRTGDRQEGVLYSTRALFAKVDQAVGAALAGFVLTLISFPPQAQPGEVAPEVLTRLAVAYALSGAPAFVALVFYARYRGRPSPVLGAAVGSAAG
jgi:Na+/melibiose symporter-like transporter